MLSSEKNLPLMAKIGKTLAYIYEKREALTKSPVVKSG